MSTDNNSAKTEEVSEQNLSRSAKAAQKRADVLAEKIQKAKERVKELEQAKIAKDKLVSKLTDEATVSRKEFRRKQALIGAMIMFEWRKDPAFEKEITARLDKFYTRPGERLALGLTAATKKKEAEQT